MTTPGRGFRPSGRPAGRRAVLAGALATAATVLGTAASRAAAPPDGKALVTVDFATATPATSMSGFLNSIRYPDPPTAMIAPLQPRLWRSNDLRLHGDIRSWGARFEGPLSDGWSHPVGGNWAPPYEDFPKWEGFVRTIARETRGREIWWDIWNEPDSPGSWLGPRDLFFETWIRAARVLREELGPGTLVGGPSTTSFQPEFIEALLAKCLASQTQINFLAWHELEPWSDISLVAENIRLARRKFLNDPRWAALGLREIHIHEFLGEVDQYRPGELVAFLWFLESGGADAASRSCWSGACTDNSIDGIIDSVTRQPRADWWVHRFYAEGVNARVRWHAGERHVVAIARLPAIRGDGATRVG
jgi:hypothetical protein